MTTARIDGRIPVPTASGPAPDGPVDIAELVAGVVDRIAVHHGRPTVPLPVTGAKMRTDHGPCVRFGAVWFIGNVNHGVGVDVHSRHHLVRAWNHSGTVSSVEFRVEQVAAGHLDFAAGLVWLLPYQPLEQCMRAVGCFANAVGAGVHMPRVGCGLAGGSWDDVEPIINRALAGVPVTVYDLPARGY